VVEWPGGSWFPHLRVLHDPIKRISVATEHFGHSMGVVVCLNWYSVRLVLGGTRVRRRLDLSIPGDYERYL